MGDKKNDTAALMITFSQQRTKGIMRMLEKI